MATSTVDVVLDKEGSTTSIAKFLEANTDLSTIKAKRDGAGGLFKWVGIAIFGWLLFSPALVLVPEMEEPAVVAVLWIVVGLLMISKAEYVHRGELWFICLCRGVIVDMPKTDAPKKWLCSVPVLLSIIFLGVYAVVSYVGLDPEFKFKDGTDALSVCLGVLGILFILLLAKGTVDVEGATGTLSLNLALAYFNDPTMLAARGFTTVHLSQIVAFVNSHRANRRPFSWDDVHALSHEEVKMSCGDKLVGGMKAVLFLKPKKDLDA